MENNVFVYMMQVSKPLNLNHTIFSQFASLDLTPPNTLSDLPQVLSHLQDKLVSCIYDTGVMTVTGKGLTREKPVHS